MPVPKFVCGVDVLRLCLARARAEKERMPFSWQDVVLHGAGVTVGIEEYS